VGNNATIDEFVTPCVAEFALVGTKKFFRGPNLAGRPGEIAHDRPASCNSPHSSMPVSSIDRAQDF
jgi:hypothetical protein